MKTLHYFLRAICLMAILAGSATAQNIVNTLGANGFFRVKSASTDFFTLSQSTGNATMYRNLELGNDYNSTATTGVITKAGFPFLHTFAGPGTQGSNTFVGSWSGNFTMGGVNSYDASRNTGVGYSALGALTTGRHNAAHGFQALTANTTGNYNSALGSLSLMTNSTGEYNSGFGMQSLSQNDGGSGNSAVGYQALYSANSGNNNTAVGREAGYNVTSGTNLTMLGYNARPSSATAADEITLGNGSITALRCNVQAISSLSDVRDKREIRDLDLGLSFLMTIQPRLFNWDRREWYPDGLSDGSKMQLTPTAGFIAQELDDAQMKAQAGWLKLVLKDNPGRLEATPGNLLPVLVKAVQELKLENDQEVAELRREYAAAFAAMKTENAALKGALTSLRQEMETLKVMQAKVALLEQAIARSLPGRDVSSNDLK